MNASNPQPDARLAALQARRDAVMAKFAAAFEAVEQRDPKFLEAKMRQNQVRFDGHASRQAMNWLITGESPGPVTERWNRLSTLTGLHAATKMLGDAVDAGYLQISFLNGYRFWKLISRTELAVELKQRFPDLAGSELNDPPQLWAAFSARMPAFEKPLADEIDEAFKQYGWTKDFMKALVPMWERGVYKSVYSDYQDIHRPPEIKEYQRELIPIDNEMNAFKQAKS
jgi:hypothetical protein